MMKQLDDLTELLEELSKYGRAILWGPDADSGCLAGLWQVSLNLYTKYPGAKFKIESERLPTAIEAAADCYLKLESAMGVQVDTR